MASAGKLELLLDKLIEDANRILGSAETHISDREGLRKWANELILFKSVAGDLVKPWSHILKHTGGCILADELKNPLAALVTIKFAMANGLLTRFEDLVIAEAFADLYEQAAYLLSQNYSLAAGVILRAVLEEKLRKLCRRNACVPTKPNPTINDYNQALYTAPTPVYDKTTMLHVTAMAAVGNDAAHNSPLLTKEAVERLARDVQAFLAKFGA